MNRRPTLTLLLGSVALILLCAATPASCWQPTVPPIGPPVMGPAAPPCPPPACGPIAAPIFMGPCVPKSCGKKLSVEGGGRVLYTSNELKRTYNGITTDFVRDLNFSQGTTLGELYVAGRISPNLALTYTFMIPREDKGYGVLPGPFRIGNTTFAAGEQVSMKSETTVHRWEGEFYPVVGPKFRLGALILGELLVEHLRVESATLEDSKNYSKFLMGVGGVAELAMAQNVFGRVKAAYMFLDSQNGVFLDGEGKYFPDFSTSCGYGSFFAGARPYVGAGYRWRYSDWSKDGGSDKLIASIYGPYAEIGVIF